MSLRLDAIISQTHQIDSNTTFVIHAAPASRKARASQGNFGAAGRAFDSTRVRVLAKDERMTLG